MEKLNRTKILVILGPTASGKSDLAVKLAQKFEGEVISADSRQVYKGLNIGTGKITKREMKGVKHHLLDVASPRRRFSASDFVILTNKAIAKIVKIGKAPIVCGGTGFYVDALLGDKQIPEVPPNPKLRAMLEKKSVTELFDILKKLDPERAKNIDSKNPRRLVRAIEICRALGQVPKQALNPKSEIRNIFKILKIGIRTEETGLKDRINRRIDKWFKQGLLKEVKDLHQKGLSWKRMGEIGLEYRLVAKYLKKEITKEEMVSRMQIETYQYAKRQLTWFKKTENIFWFERSEIKKIEGLLGKFYRS